MRILKLILLIVLTGLCMAGCRTTSSEVDPTAFTEIRITMYPKDWGYAYKAVQPDGSIVGGHMSGGPDASRVVESKSQVTPEDLAKLKRLAAKLFGKSGDEGVSPPDQHVAGHAAVTVAFADGHAFNAIAEEDKPFASKTVQRIWDIVQPYTAGSW